MLRENAEQKMKVVIGLGKTGLSCARYLASRNEKFKVLDTRKNPPGLLQLKAECPDVELVLGELDAGTLMNAEQLIVSPGVDQKIPVIQNAINAGVPVTGDVDIFAKAVTAPIIGITGSNAKTTVTTLVGEMAKQDGIDVAVAGNIGLPVLDLLKIPEASLYVLELSSFQLETTHDLGAEIATILNVSLDHMDRYNSLDEYQTAKQRIFQGCHQAVVNLDEPEAMSALPAHIKQWRFTIDESKESEFSVLTINNIQYLGFNKQALMPVSALKIAGSHNVSNALAALAIGYAAGISMESMLATLRVFPGLPHRCQWISQIKDVNWYNDSKGTNVGATTAAINGLGKSGKIILLAGGQGKGADFSELRKPLAAYGKLAILFGEDAALIDNAVCNVVMTVTVGTLQEAVRLANEKAKGGDVVLLSPACASFDMFSNYEERGEVFAHCVRELH